MLINYVFDGTSRNYNSNEILKELANDAIKNLRSTRLNVNFDLQIVLESNVNRSCKIKLACFNSSVHGDHLFRGFDVSDVLMPDRADFEFFVSSKTDSSGYREFTRDNYPVTWTDTVFQQYDFPYLDLQKDSIHLSSVFLYYDENALNRFHERLNLIHDYYASCAILDSLLVLANSMDLQKEDLYAEYFIFIEEINKAVEIIGQKKFQNDLNLPVYDPKEFRRKFRELFKFSKSITMTFEERLEKAESIHPAISVDSVIALFISGMMRYVEWTLLVNERNGNVYHEYLDNYYSLNAFGDDLFILKKLLRKISPDVYEDTSMFHVFHKISKAYHAKIEALMKENHYAEAIELIENARRFSEYNPFPEKERFDNSARFIAAIGIYTSYLGVAESSIRNRKFEMAEAYLAKALAYRQVNFLLQLPDSLYRTVFLELVQEQIAECDSLAAEKKFQESLDCFRYFEASYDSSSIVLILPDIKRKKERVYAGLINDMLLNAEKNRLKGDADSALILFDLVNFYVTKMEVDSGLKARIDSMSPEFDKIRYMQLLASVSNHFQVKEYLLAYTEMNKAKEILQKYHLAADTMFETLWHLVYSHHLQYLLMVSEKKIWLNQLQDAETFADSIAALQSSVEFATDYELSKAIEKYRIRIKEKVCLNAKEAIEIYELRGRYYLEQKNFLLSKILWDSALYVDEDAKSCHLANGFIRDTLKKYEEAILFQQSMAEIENRISVNQYKEAVAKYMETESFFSKHAIARFGIACKNFFDYVKEKSNLRLTIEAVKLFTGKTEYQKALEYLKLYRLQDGKAFDVKEIQRFIGKEMANSDFIKMTEKEPSVLLEAYTGHDKWMANFERTYLFQWNVLRNSSSTHSPIDE